MTYRKFNLIICFIFSIFLFACLNTESAFIVENGISIERPNKEIVNENFYLIDNEVYIENREFIYDFDYISASNDTMKQRIIKNKSVKNKSKKIDWEIVKQENITEKTIEYVGMKIQKGIGPFEEDYNQTVIEYRFYSKEKESIGGIEVTGVIENGKNVWLHPPRRRLFSVLQINPFPYIKFPIKDGFKWDWNNNVGDRWSSKLWTEWEGTLQNKCTYEIVGRETCTFDSKKIPCWVVDAKCKNDMGETLLTSFYNDEYGFVRLDYINIDKSKFLFQLAEVK